jgi:hypothetical protein
MICSLLLAIASLLGILTIGRFYLPAVIAAIGVTIWQFRLDHEKRDQLSL